MATKAGEKKPRGRPCFEPTDEQRAYVASMVGCGIQQDKISQIIGCAPKTLRKHFQHELETGETIANAEVARSLFDQAIGGNVTAAIWWTKSRMGWTEKSALDQGLTTREMAGQIRDFLKRADDSVPE